MLHEQCDFFEAVRKIAAITGTPLEEEKNYDREAWQLQRQQRTTLRELLTQAATSYRSLFWQSDAAEAARQYMKTERGYDDETLCQWGIGFCPDWRTLAHDYNRKGLLPKSIELGICKETDKGFYDFFHHRIIFPVLDERGEIVTLAGRTVGNPKDKEPKYLNGVESPLYNKSKTIYGLYQAIPHIKDQGFAILTEGYTDVISMHRSGAQNTIATCGTALTEDHCRLTKKYTKHVVLMRDGDKAGQKALEKDLEILLRFDFTVDVFSLPDKSDPDEFAKQFLTEEAIEA